MKKIVLFLFIAIIFLLAAITLVACNEPEYFVVEFLYGEGGMIEGELVQTVEKGKSSTPVVAKALDGYYFEFWSDLTDWNTDESVTQNVRVIENVQKSNTYLANFKKKYVDPDPLTKTYKYNYKYADRNCDDKDITLVENTLSEVALPVPERDHCTFKGWFADQYYETQVADENGKLLIDNDFLNSDCTQFYAKWTTDNTFTFKLLIVYVTELQADLETCKRDDIISVNYKMTTTERKICEMITKKVSWYLNDIAVANFQVDEYFTTVPVTKENMHIAGIGQGMISNGLYAANMPEVQELAKEYDSVLTSYSMKDYNNLLHNSSGVGGPKHGYVNFDSCLSTLVANNIKFNTLLDDENNHHWNGIIDTYLHELAHTIEQKIRTFDYHKVLSVYMWDLDIQKPLALYFLNKAVVNGQKVGIPYGFWEGKMHRAFYIPINNYGHITAEHYVYVDGENPKNGVVTYVIYGQPGIGVTAEPYRDEYEFVEWSDGVKTPYRKDENLTEDIYVYAIFAKKEN